MQRGTVTREVIGRFDSRNTFKIPTGTRVIFGQLDCTGDPFDAWALPEHTARELSGNAHDSKHRFVTVDKNDVAPDAEFPAEYGLYVAWRPYRCDCCGALNQISTNHTGPLCVPCRSCSWRGARDSGGKLYRADTGKARPHYYVGPEPHDAERNPHAQKEV